MKRRRLYAVIALVAVVLPVGCGDSRSTTQPSFQSAPPFPSFSLSGRVVDTAYRPLAATKVEVVSGPRAGAIEITDEDGGFSLPGIFNEPVTLTASRNGHHPETRTFPPPDTPISRFIEGGSWHVQIYLSPLGPPADLAGVYTVTMSADSACSGLPADTRSRTYTATVLPAGRSQFIAKLSGARFHSIPCSPGRPPETCTYDRIGIGLAGDYASIGVGIIEELREGGFLTFQAGTAGTFGPAGISAPLEGAISYCSAEPVLIDQGTWWCPVDTGVGCDSPTHQLTLTRR